MVVKEYGVFEGFWKFYIVVVEFVREDVRI